MALATALIAYLAVGVYASDGHLNRSPSAAKRDATFEWANLTPSANLTWVPCEEQFQCARLLVPADYSDPSGPQAAIALMKVPSTIPAGADGYRGPVLFNPGGPGLSGTQLILQSGQQFQTILGDDYDLIGFDPRGLGETTPAIPTLLNSSLESAVWSLQMPPLLDASPDALGRSYERAQIFGELASYRLGDIVENVGTALVATDMLTIMQAHGRDKLQYWGFSYGSVLGITYASMFPDKIERMIIDGVEDPVNYYATLWSNNLLDHNKTDQAFYDACAAASPADCALHESTGDLVHQRVNDIFASLMVQPIRVPTNSSAVVHQIVDYNLVRLGLWNLLYRPFLTGSSSAGAFAAAMAALEQGDALPYSQLPSSAPPSVDCDGPVAPGLELQLSIACGDGDPVMDSVEQLRELFETMFQESVYADILDLRLMCSGWKGRANERFTGPFGGNTSFPLMLIGNTADPITPIRNAFNASSNFTGSVVLTQNGPGHTSLAAASLCTAQNVRAYFRNGTLPTPGTVCEIDVQMFGSNNSTVESREVHDDELLDAMKELSASAPVGYMRGGH